MSVVCALCNTENRDAAKFCRGCGTRLVRPPVPPLRTPELPPGLFDPSVPAPSPQPAGSRLTTQPEDATVILSATAPSPSPVRGAMALPAETIRSGRKGLWIGLALLLAMLAGGGTWYVLRSPASAPTVAEAPAATSAPAAAPAPAPVPAQATPRPPPAPEPAPPAVAAAPKPSPAPAQPAPPSKSRKPAPTPAAAAVESASASGAPAPAPAPPPAANPQAACAGRNFIAMAQCMASQCAKAEFKATSQCEAVRAQQRLEEEKRNPGLLH